MQARLIPGSSGWRWLARGWKIFRAGPVMWLALVFAYWILMTMVSIVPLVGVVAVLILVPGFSVAFMAASRVAERGQPIKLSLIFAGFHENRRAQITLGGVYLASMVLLLAASTLVDDGALARWMVTGARPTAQVLQSDGFLGALLVAAALYMPVMMLFWFAPTLVAWHAMPVAKALFFSLVACLMNWRAFMVYGLASAMALFVVPFLVLFALMLASGGTLRPGVMAVLFPFVLSLMPTMFASFYVSYRDIFLEQDPVEQGRVEQKGPDGPPRSPLSP
ncbi:MAG: hypothetical protein EXR29_01780 [Betaproteobacteria bacterium]|nr:hypothetical protein [Betaproteobacteria bacterium]